MAAKREKSGMTAKRDKNEMAAKRAKLEKIVVDGFKSLGSSPPSQKHQTESGPTEIEFGDVTVLLGANGAGKSNIISLLEMLHCIAEGRFQEFVTRSGGGDAILHYSSKHGERIDLKAELSQRAVGQRWAYNATLNWVPPDGLLLWGEHGTQYQSLRDGTIREGPWVGRLHSRQHPMRSHLESRILASDPIIKDEVASALHSVISSIQTIHLRDTSANSPLRLGDTPGHPHPLYSDGKNLAVLLTDLRDNYGAYYERVRDTIRQVFPQFSDFVLESPKESEPKRKCILNWRDNAGGEYVLKPHQIPDGALRFMALATVLLQPPELLPRILVLDEPEMGLHPGALTVLAGLIRYASDYCQVVIATQSAALVDHFDISEIRPVEFRNGSSHVLKLDPKEYKHWLKRYTTGELWAKDVLGGGPRYD